MDSEDVIIDGLGDLNIGSAGHFTVIEDSTADLNPLLSSSTESATLPAIQVQMLADPETLQDGFTPTGESYVLAARLNGSLTSAFPDGPPTDDGISPDAEGNTQSDGGATLASNHLSSTNNANVILVGDVDILSDRLWVQRQSFLGQQLVTAFANNGDFVINSLDNLSGSAELIGIRARGTYSRPFTRVEELRRNADAEFRQTEQFLQAELVETESRLAELQAARTDQGSLLISDEQQAEIQRFLDQQVRIRQDLRAVQRNLDRSIEQLGTVLQIINTALIPILLTILVLVVVSIRRRRAEK